MIFLGALKLIGEPCKVCGNFICSSYLAQHQRIHFREKPYRCDECRGVSVEPTLGQHQRTHGVGRKPYRHDVSSECSVSSRHLRHHRIYMGGELCGCGKCGKASVQILYSASESSHWRGGACVILQGLHKRTPQNRWVKQQKFNFPRVPGAEKPKVKMPATPFSGEGILPDLQMTVFLLCMCMMETELWARFLLCGTISKDQGPALTTSLNLNISIEAPSLNIATLV